MELLALPVFIAKFWFLEAPLGLFRFFFSLNGAYLRFFSFSTLVRTFFKPLKNEYRKGLVGFSVGMGIFVKTFMIIISVGLLGIMYIVEFFILIFFVIFPFLTFYLLFI